MHAVIAREMSYTEEQESPFLQLSTEICSELGSSLGE